MSDDGIDRRRVPARPFTAVMRDRQARGKDAYEPAPGPGGSDDGADNGGKKRLAFESLERQRQANQMLDNPELLLMASIRDEESVPATRSKYWYMLCGIEEPSRARAGPAAGTTAGSSSGGGGGGGSGGSPSQPQRQQSARAHKKTRR
ncbi:hypothetical protein GGR56DRAFT_366388 [Xylariaceae sp. FL0804]|nr:hypothetical protein GGR56DRAFT_366388 [Xylariaceae sp. FL0804]